MTYEEALWEFEDIKEISSLTGGELRACEIAEEVLEMRIAKEPEPVEHRVSGVPHISFFCPTCRSMLRTNPCDDYCPFCGQKLKWYGDDEI